MSMWVPRAKRDFSSDKMQLTQFRSRSRDPQKKTTVFPCAVRDGSGELTITSLVDDAHAAGLEVHPYTFRADDLPEYTNDFDSLLRLFVEQIGIDGMFTDFPDKAVAWRNQLSN